MNSKYLSLIALVAFILFVTLMANYKLVPNLKGEIVLLKDGTIKTQNFNVAHGDPAYETRFYRMTSDKTWKHTWTTTIFAGGGRPYRLDQRDYLFKSPKNTDQLKVEMYSNKHKQIIDTLIITPGG